MMARLELPGVHMHWADRWGLRGAAQWPEIERCMVVELKEGSTITVLEAPDVLPFDEALIDEPLPRLPLRSVPVTITLQRPEPEPEPQPWFTIRCSVCDQEIAFYLEVDLTDLNPFNATVIATQCEQCASRWAAVLPPVRVMEADKLNLREVDIIDGSTD
jgi:hypothetical protein